MDSNNVKGEVETRLVQLHSLKSHRYEKFFQYKQEYKQVALKDKKKEDGEAKYSMNTGFALCNAKAAAILASPPKYDFAALDDEAARYKRVKEVFWEYVWETSGTSREIGKIVLDAMKYGVGFGLETIAIERRTVQEPTINSEDGAISFEDKEIVDYEGCKLSHLSWDRVFLNGRTIEDSSEAVVIDYLDRNEFLARFSSSPLFTGVTEENIPKGKYYYVAQGSSELIMGGGTDRKDTTVQDDDVVSVLYYWNRYRDEYVVLANGVWINPIKGKVSPILTRNKEIPLVVYTDHFVEDDIYGLGEFDITAKSRRLKDTARSMAIEVVKAQVGLITIDPDSDFDEAIMEFGIRKFARVERDKIGFFAPNVNSQTITYIEAKADEDITIESGVDFRSLASGSSDTATATQGKIQSQRERIALNMKMNAYTFFERLARIRSSNMEMWYGDKEIKIPTRGMNISDEGNVEYINSGYGLFTMKPKYFGGKCALIPRVESMVGDTSESKRQEYLQMLQLLLNIIDPATGKPMFDPRKLIEAGRGIIDKVIDLDKINEKTKVSKSPEQILGDAEGETPTQVEDGSIPPEQRSGRPVLLPSMQRT